MIFIKNLGTTYSGNCQCCGIMTEKGQAVYNRDHVPVRKQSTTETMFEIQFGNRERHNGAKVVVCFDCMDNLSDEIDDAIYNHTTFIDYNTKCHICGEEKILKVRKDELKAYVNGAFVQVAFGDMSKEDRERIKTGICPTCWDKINADEEEEEE